LTFGRYSLFDNEVLFLDFECKNFIAGNKKCCLPRIVDFSEISQVVYCGTSFFFVVMICKVIVAFCIFQSSCSSASPSCVSEEFLRCKVDQVLDRVVEELISEAAIFVALESE
jgi:hypothetical protein